MIDFSKVLDVAGEVVALGMAVSVIFSRFNELQKEITRLRHHIESHCQMLNHLGEHLQTKTGYEPIDKQPID